MSSDTFFMRFKYPQYLFFLSLLIFSLPSLEADYFSPSHGCSQPWDKSDRYDVENFKQCIEDFVDEMNDQASEHIEAANDAINDWNNFASY